MATKTMPNMPKNIGAGVVMRYSAKCTGCRMVIAAQTRRQWQRAVSAPCPHCGIRGW